MADTYYTIGDLPLASSLVGDEVIEIQQAGASKKADIQSIADLAAPSTELIQDIIGGTIEAGPNMLVSYNDTLNKVTLEMPDAAIDTLLTSMLQAGSNISITHDATNKRFTISSAGGSNSDLSNWNGYKVGHIYPPGDLFSASTTATGSLVANRFYFIPIAFTKSVILDQIGFRRAGTGSGSFGIAIYALDNVGQPTGSPIAYTASTLVSSIVGSANLMVGFSGGPIVASGKATIPIAGRYAGCICTDNPANMGAFYNNSQLRLAFGAPTALSQLFGTSSEMISAAYKDGTFGSWPDMTGQALTFGVSATEISPVLGVRIGS